MRLESVPEATVTLLTVDLHYATAEHEKRPSAHGLVRHLFVGLIGIDSIPSSPALKSKGSCTGSATNVGVRR